MITILIAFAFASASNAALASPGILLERDIFAPDEKITITLLNTTPTQEVTIQSETKIFKYSGDLQDKLEFYAHEPGEYTITLTDEITNGVKDVNDERKIRVVAGYFNNDKEVLSTDKKEYVLGEEVMILVNVTSADNAEISIIAPSESLRYLDRVESSIRFMPKEAGLHKVQLRKDFEPIAETTFTVLAAGEKPEPEEGPAEGQSNLNAVTLNMSEEGEEAQALENIYKTEEENSNASSLSNSTAAPAARTTVSATPEDLPEGLISARIPRMTVFEEEPDEEDGDETFQETLQRGLGRSPARPQRKLRIELENPSPFIKSMTLAEVTDESGTLAMSTDPADLGIRTEEVPRGQINRPKDRVMKAYAIDPTSLNFSYGIARIIATGRELWKCKEWDYDNQQCLGTWKKVMDITPGKEYDIRIDSEDPGYIEIAATNALHLDENKNFISNIYDEIKGLDGTWSERIYENEYVRVTFEKDLTSRNDITIYSRNTQGLNTTVEIYYHNTTDLIATFPAMTDQKYYKVFLKGMNRSDDTFDLRIVNYDPPEAGRAYLEFDHITDPEITGLEDWEAYADYTVTFNGNWTNTGGDNCDWQTDSGTTNSGSTGPTNDHTTGTSTGQFLYLETSTSPPPGSSTTCGAAVGNEAYLVSSDLDADWWNITISFWYNMYGSSMGAMHVDVYDGTWHNDIWSLSGNQGDVWTYQEINLGSYEGTINIRFRGTSGSSYTGDMAIDDINVTGTYKNDPPTTPTNIQCDGSDNCNITIQYSVVLNASGSTDPEGDEITYILETTFSGSDSAGPAETGSQTHSAGTDYFSTLYNYAICTPGTDCWAYADDVDVFPFGGSTGNRNSHVQATTAQYGYINADNTDQWETIDPGTNDEIFLWLEMEVDETPSNVYEINFTFNGNTDTYTTDHCIYLMTAGASWEQSASWTQLGTCQSIAPDVDTSFTRNMSSSLSDYIGTGGLVTWGVYETTSSDNLRINYVQMEVYYTVTRDNDYNETYVEYSSIGGSDFSNIDNMTLTVQINDYEPRGSSTSGNARPDLQVRLYNGSGYTYSFLYGLNSVFGDSASSTDTNFTFTITDSNILQAWKNPANRLIEIRAVNLDTQGGYDDLVNWTGGWITISGDGWMEIGNHTETETFTWNVTGWDDTDCLDLRTKAIDLDGIANYSSYFTKDACLTIAAPPLITINSVGGDETETYVFPDQTPIVNATITRDSNCYLSPADETYAQMIANGRINCGAYTRNEAKECEYTTTIPLGTWNLYMACNSTNGLSNNATNNKDMSIEVVCDSHSDCPGNQYCDYTQHCSLDVIPGYNCNGLAYAGLGNDEVCGNGTDSYCVNDTTYYYTGWYCTATTTDCVYNNNGNSYALTYRLCNATGNDYKMCSAGNNWSATWTDCGEQYDPDNQSATTHPGEYCGYFSTAQTCTSGISGGCSGGASNCGPHIYNQTTHACGATLTTCDVGCGASCDTTNSTTASIISGICYYNKGCSAACAWSQASEEAPSYCIGDNDGGACAYSFRTDPTSAETCYWSPSCTDGSGASLDLGTADNLRADYCDYCNATGNQTGGYAPEPNASCTSGCADSGTIYYDTGLTPSDRSDDCRYGTSTIMSDTLTTGDIWNGSSPAYCDDTECDLDCGTEVGMCNAGICGCTDIDYPLIELISPNPEVWSSTGSIVFTYNVTDISNGIENCSLVINGTTYQTNNTIDKSLSEQYFFQDLTNGTYNWSIRCYDNSTSNNMNWTEGRFIGVDTVPPSISNPMKNSTSTFKISDTVCMNVSASDQPSGIGRVYALVTLPSGSTEEVDLYDDVTTPCDSANGDGIYSAQYTILYSGDFNWTDTYAVDLAGNTQGVTAGYYWNVTEGGNLIANMTAPTSSLTINESDGTNSYQQTCNATCDWGFVNCNEVELFVQYSDGISWHKANTSTIDISTNTDSHYCGDLSAIQAPWWNLSFQYRQQMRINAKSAVAADHVIRVDFDTTGSKFRDDAEDLRIVYWNGSENIEVDRQVFRPNQTDSSIWFVVGEALLANTSNFNYYIYYGNATATGAKNNQSNIWLFYDDFSDGSYAGDWGYGGGTYSIASVANPWSGANYALSVGGCAVANSYLKVLTSSLSPIRDMTSRILWLDNPGNACTGGSPDADGVVGLHGSATTAYDGLLVERDTDTGFHYDIGATGSLTGSQYYSPFNVWQWSEARAYGTTAAGYKARYWLYNESEPQTYPLQATAVTATSAGQPFIRTASGVAYVAVIMVRPSVEQEPVTEMKGEEDAGIIGNNSCQHTFTVTAGANSGNKTLPIRCEATSTNSEYGYSNNVSLKINDHPVANISQPTPGGWTTGITTINASYSYDSDGTISWYYYEYDNNSAFSSPSVICSISQSNCTWNTTTQDKCLNNTQGCYLRITVTDSDGLTNSTYISFGIDTQGPTTILDQPWSYANITANMTTTNATATDNQTTVNTVILEFRYNSTEAWTTICNDTTQPYSCTWNLSLLPDGAYYEVRAFANDSTGNTGPADTHTNITIDRNGPEIRLMRPQNNNYTSNYTVVLEYNASDLMSEVANCSLLLQGIVNDTDTRVPEDTPQSFTTTFQTEGIYNWSIRCYDVNGNLNVSETRNVTIDKTGPVTMIDEPDSWENITGGVTSFKANATTYDLGIGGIESVSFEYRENGGAGWTSLCTDTSGPEYNCTWDVSGLPDGPYYEVRAYANDTLGNNGSYDSRINITIDNHPPQITPMEPAEGYIDDDGNVYVRYSAIDNGSNVEECRLYWQGSLNQTETGPLTEGQTYTFTLLNVSNGGYQWYLRCNDTFGQAATTSTYNITIDIRYDLYVNVTANSQTYEKGNQQHDYVNMTNNVTGAYGGSIPDANTTTDIIRLYNTSQKVAGWWNTSWPKRKPIYLSNPTGSNLTNTLVTVNITGLAGNITNCSNGMRIADINNILLPAEVVLGDNYNHCTMRFLANISANAVNENRYYAYYNNLSSTAANPANLAGFTLPLENWEAYADYTVTFNGNWTNTGGDNCDWQTDSGTTASTSTGPTNDHTTGTSTGQFLYLETSTSAPPGSSTYCGTTGYEAYLQSVALNASQYNITLSFWYNMYGTSMGAMHVDIYDGTWHNDVWTLSGNQGDVWTYQEINLGSYEGAIILRFRGTRGTSYTGDMAIDDISVTGTSKMTINTSVGTPQEWKVRRTNVTNMNGLSWAQGFNITSYAQGNYSAATFATKTQYKNAYNFTLFQVINDKTPPAINLQLPENQSEENSSVTFTYIVNDTLSTVLNCTLIIDGNVDAIDDVIEEGPTQFFFPRIPAGGWHNWSVNCTDYYNNTGSSDIRSIYIKPPDLYILELKVNNSYPNEGDNITIQATIPNIGGSDAQNVVIQFWLGDPDAGGTQINGNFTANITDGGGSQPSVTFNTSHVIDGPGPFTFYAVVDPPTATNGSILELNESNNKANVTAHAPGYQYYYGNVTTSIYLANDQNQSLYYYINITKLIGNIFAASDTSQISFDQLQALGRNSTNQSAAFDFSEVDAALNMTGFNDSINKAYTGGTNIPLQTQTITVFNKTINNIPVVNSTNTTDFVTGILWDASDGGTEYNGTQDILFINPINQKKTGKYGVYDYEIKVPVTLENFKAGTAVSLYWEIKA
ncbi:DUF2341 domain-containing protein [Candidatus Woesearchaeota archaeon]|nr:DUF2341 domain-containing protein [Candidatus Woesearchaeota archaeon]